VGRAAEGLGTHAPWPVGTHRRAAAASLATRLAPWTQESFRQLFDGPGTVVARGHLVVWSTRHLPDELRAAGMVLALHDWQDIDVDTYPPPDPSRVRHHAVRCPTPRGPIAAATTSQTPLANPQGFVGQLAAPPGGQPPRGAGTEPAGHPTQRPSRSPFGPPTGPVAIQVATVPAGHRPDSWRDTDPVTRRDTDWPAGPPRWLVVVDEACTPSP
jgi:hypothetical protein